MNSFTAQIDAMNFNHYGSTFTKLEEVMFGNDCDRWWDETYRSICDDEESIYNEVIPLYASLIANLPEEDLREIIRDYRRN